LIPGRRRACEVIRCEEQQRCACCAGLPSTYQAERLVRVGGCCWQAVVVVVELHPSLTSQPCNVARDDGGMSELVGEVGVRAGGGSVLLSEPVCFVLAVSTRRWLRGC
jgi:hypothetical protein